MAGVDKLRPKTPRILRTWKVETVLTYIKTLGENDNLSWHLFNKKLVTLLALSNYKRASDIFILDTRFCVVEDDLITFHLKETPKQHREIGVLPPPVHFARFLENELLCPVEGLKKYLTMTDQYRISSASTRLMLSHVGKHNPVSRDTIRRWLKELLAAAVIDTSLYQGHSIRAAALSNDKQKGVSIKDILKSGGWSRESTWQRFYNKQIL